MWFVQRHTELRLRVHDSHFYMFFSPPGVRNVWSPNYQQQKQQKQNLGIYQNMTSHAAYPELTADLFMGRNQVTAYTPKEQGDTVSVSLPECSVHFSGKPSG